MVFGLGKNGLDHTVHQQIRVAPDRAGEVRVGIERQAEMSAIDRRVNGLRHGAQQHRVDLLRVGSVFSRLSNRLKLPRCGVVTDRHANATGLQIATQYFLLLRRRTLMHSEQTLMLVLGNEVRTADVRCEHGLFNQPMRCVASTRHDLFDPTVFITNNLCLRSLEIHRTPLVAGFEQCLVNTMQVQEVLHSIFALASFRPSCIAKNGRHFGVSEPSVAPHHCRVKLVGIDLAILGDEHIAHHAQPFDFRV